MPASGFRLQDYAAYLERVGEATYIDCTRRTDPARVARVWENLVAVVAAYGPPWIVQLWTKDPRGVVERGGSLIRELRARGTAFACQLTVTGLGGSRFEPRAPRDAFGDAGGFLDLIGGPAHCAWRFDPIIPGLDTMERFERLAPLAAALGIRRLVINFACEPGTYKRADARLREILPYWEPGLAGIDPAWREEMARAIVERAATSGFETYSCAEGKALLSRVPGLKPPGCGDFAWFCALSGRSPRRPPSRGSRRGCGCADYFDVGCYGMWRSCHGCAYCYAG